MPIIVLISTQSLSLRLSYSSTASGAAPDTAGDPLREIEPTVYVTAL